MKKLFTITTLCLLTIVYSQNKAKKIWYKKENYSKIISAVEGLSEKILFDLDADALKKNLEAAPQRVFNATATSAVTITLPNTEGTLESFMIFENSQMEPELAAKYPDIKSYIGIGIDDFNTNAYFSFSPYGFSATIFHPDKETVFIEPFTADNKTYTVYNKKDNVSTLSEFNCETLNTIQKDANISVQNNVNDGILRTYRLAVSASGEYTKFCGGRTPALAAINTTITRVNSVYEREFNIKMVLIANNDKIIYDDPSTDPYTESTSYNTVWLDEVQNTLTNVIGDNHYDIGHLFRKGNINAGKGEIASVCKNPSDTYQSKGRGYTSHTKPKGDMFDIDYVAHEIGHQFGANHTFSFSYKATGTQVEPGSGSSIMGYAGTGSYDVQPASDHYFNGVSIAEIAQYIKSTTCAKQTITGNAIPTVSAGINYTIPRGTPFKLTAWGNDANRDLLTYCWEQIDDSNKFQIDDLSAASSTKTSGPTFRSYKPKLSNFRYFPEFPSILAGSITTMGTKIMTEAVPTVARTLHFRVTIRDNKGANQSDDMQVTVSEKTGPFTVSNPNTGVVWSGKSIQTVSWNVAGTNVNDINCKDVDILISTDEGKTWIMLLAETPNDGLQEITVPNNASKKCRIMVRAVGNIFFDVSNSNFTIELDTIPPSAPTNLQAIEITPISAKLNWTPSTDNIGVVAYDIYQDGVLKASTKTTTFNITGLLPVKDYTFTIKARDIAGNVSSSSKKLGVKTLPLNINYCLPECQDASYENINKVVLGTINNVSTSTLEYEDFTSISTYLTRGQDYKISIKPWVLNSRYLSYAVWIDYNNNGSFMDLGELVWSKGGTLIVPENITTEEGVITIPVNATIGVLRMRVAVQYEVGTQDEASINPCMVNYGQVEDYTVVINYNIGPNENETQKTHSSTNHFELYPNPVTNVLKVNYPNNKGASYTIYDATGRIFKWGELTSEINLSHLTQGLYIFEIKDNQKTIVKKIMKN